MMDFDLYHLPEERLAFLSQQVFSNHLILQHISKKFSFDDLKLFRLVSTFCKEACLSVWKSQAVICLGPYKGWGKISVQEFMGRLESSQNLTLDTFRNFRMLFGSLPPVNLTEMEWESRLDLKFWKECGANIKHLHLKHVNFNQRKLANMICNLTPNLESLFIECVNKKPRAGWAEPEAGLLITQEKLKVLRVCGRLPFPQWNFLKYFPNLKEIVLGNDTNDHLIQDLNTLRSEEQGRILNLECLDVIHTQQSMEGLAEARLPLKHLSLRLERNVKEPDLQRIVESLASTLQSLRLFRFPLANWSPLYSIPLQVNFSSLKELHLWGNVVSSFNFLKWMPSLKTLVLDLLCHGQSLEIYSCSSTMESQQCIEPHYEDMVQASNVLLTEDNFTHENLECFQIDFAFDRESLSILREWMPNLKGLRSIFNNATFSQVCSQWPKLEQLKVMYGSDVCDKGITGITWSPNVGQEERKPNLSDMKVLRSFELECYCDMSQISDLSAHQAFLIMPHLEHLRICVSKQISTACEKSLMKTINHVEIFRNYGEHSKVGINCCSRVSFYYRNLSVEYQ